MKPALHTVLLSAVTLATAITGSASQARRGSACYWGGRQVATVGAMPTYLCEGL